MLILLVYVSQILVLHLGFTLKEYNFIVIGRKNNMEIQRLKLVNKVKIPIIGLGTWNLSGSESKTVIKSALKMGYRHIDTAELYNNEIEVGEAINDFDRKEIFLVSKVSPYHIDHEGVISAFKNSLSKLNTSYLDLYLIHWPPPLIDLHRYLEAFKKLYDKKKIKAFGVSNFKIKHLEKTIPICKELKLPITVNQIEVNPFIYPKELLKYCKKNNIAVTAYSPLARGRVNENSFLKELGSKYSKTPSQISLRWLIQKDFVVIPKASSEKHLKENISIFNFSLSDGDMEKMDSLGSSLISKVI